MSSEAEAAARDDDERVSLRERLGVRAYVFGSWISQRVSYDRGRSLARLTGEVLHRAVPSARRTVEANLGPVLAAAPGSASLDAAVREAFRSYCMYWFETFHLRSMPAEDVIARTRFVGLEHIDRAVEVGRGAILPLPHLGNWDAAGRWVTASGYRMTAVAEELRPAEAFRLFLEHRRALGMGIVALGSKRVGEELLERLAQNELICLVADRDLTGRGVEVEMFGAKAQLPAGPAMLSLASGAPLLPSGVFHRDDGGWEIVVDGPLEIERTDSFRADVTTLTRLLARHFERSISAAPTMWHMFQPYFSAER